MKKDYKQKKDSIAFLDKCLKKLNNATKKDIAHYKKVYDQNCLNLLTSNNFEFIPPRIISKKNIN